MKSKGLPGGLFQGYRAAQPEKRSRWFGYLIAPARMSVEDAARAAVAACERHQEHVDAARSLQERATRLLIAEDDIRKLLVEALP